MGQSTGCSGAVPRLINMQQQQMNLGQQTYFDCW